MHQLPCTSVHQIGLLTSADDAEEPADETKYDQLSGLGLDDTKEPANETKYDTSFGVDFLGYGETTKERKSNDFKAAATNEEGKAFAQTRVNNATTNEEGLAFAQTQATNDKNVPARNESGGTRRR